MADETRDHLIEKASNAFPIKAGVVQGSSSIKQTASYKASWLKTVTSAKSVFLVRVGLRSTLQVIQDILLSWFNVLIVKKRGHFAEVYHRSQSN